MKRTLILLSMFASAASAAAGGYDYLAIEQSDGSRTTIAAVGLEVTFSDGQLVATNATTAETLILTLSQLTQMFFTDTREDHGEVGLRQPGTAAWGINEADAVTDLAGREVRVRPLRPGIYVIRKGSETRKIQQP